MEDRQLKKLTVCIENEENGSVVIIFADPSVKDLKEVIRDECVLNTVNNIFYFNKDENKRKFKRDKKIDHPLIEDIYIQHKVVISQVKNEVEGINVYDIILKKEEILDEDVNIDGEGDIQDNNVQAEINSDKDEGRIFLDNIAKDNLNEGNISFNNGVEEFPSVDVSGSYNDVGDISYDDELEENVEETTEKFEDQLDKNKKMKPDLAREKLGEYITNNDKVSRFEDNINVLNSTKENFKDFQDVRKKFHCEFCGKAFSQKSNFNNHKMIHTGEKPFNCSVCNKSFSQKQSLTRHKKIHREGRLFSCKFCELTFEEFGTSRSHRKTHIDVPRVKTDKTYSCDICGKSFDNKTILNQHKIIHTGEKPYVCDTCGKSFSRRGGLKEHSLAHSGIKSFVCKFCDKKFYHKSKLNMHQKAHQPDRPTIPCTICKKELKNSGSLRNHMKLHEGVKPHVCDVCGKAYNNKTNYLVHLRNHTGEKPFSCDSCDKSFGSLNLLKKHKITHTDNKPFFCEVCNKQFAFKDHLKRHMRVHTGEKPYSCELCGKTFSFVFNLKRHKKTHARSEKKS